ncbi:MAG: glycosyltransferase family A protein [Candidatus Euphemobacter frigidus]|nr:glycosyltransferase family A protein [Candidatus Euphemobacter frigidus]MDP8275671.1 glycosyltransferase family A protein [Candidatus Euphemobacter frigidus]
MKISNAVSVIIPTYNRSALLGNAIESVLSQTFRDFILIVVDDGSTDDTGALAGSFGDRVIYIRQDNQGASSARNRGIEATRAPLIAFLDSDDRWHRDKLRRQVEAMEDGPRYLISHTQEIWYRNGEVLNQKKKHEKLRGEIFERSLSMCMVSMSTVMVRRELFERIGFFDEALPCCEDYDFWLRASVRHPFLLVDEPLTFKEGGREDQVSAIYRIGMDRFRIRSIINLLKKEILTGEQRDLAVAELERKCRIYGNGCIKWGREEEGRYYLAIPESMPVRGG